MKIDNGMVSDFLEPDDVEAILDILQFEIDEDRTKAFHYESLLRDMMSRN